MKKLKQLWCRLFGHNYWRNTDEDYQLRCARCGKLWKV